MKYIVGPDAVHNLYLSKSNLVSIVIDCTRQGEYKDAYSGAALIGVEPHLAKPELKSLHFTGVYGREGDEPSDASKFGYAAADGELEACYFSGFSNKDVAFLHKPSKTLVVADLLFNLPGKEQYSRSKSSGSFIGAAQLSPWTWAHKQFLTGQSADKE